MPIYRQDEPLPRQRGGEQPAPTPGPTPPPTIDPTTGLPLPPVDPGGIPMNPNPPSDDPGGPPGDPGPPAPPMPTIAPPTSATPISQGSFSRPGQGPASLAAFRSPEFRQGPKHGEFEPGKGFGPGTPLGGGGSTFSDTTDGSGPGGGPMSPEELLRMLQSRMRR